jgi:hypothetical protein
MKSCSLAILIAIAFFFILIIIVNNRNPEKYSGVAGYFACKRECEESQYYTRGQNYGKHPNPEICDRICDEWVGYTSGGLRIPCPGMVSGETCNKYSLHT